MYDRLGDKMASARKKNIEKFKKVKAERLGRKIKDLVKENTELKTLIKQLPKQIEEGEKDASQD